MACHGISLGSPPQFMPAIFWAIWKGFLRGLRITLVTNHVSESQEPILQVTTWSDCFFLGEGEGSKGWIDPTTTAKVGISHVRFCI